LQSLQDLPQTRSIFGVFASVVLKKQGVVIEKCHRVWFASSRDGSRGKKARWIFAGAAIQAGRRFRRGGVVTTGKREPEGDFLNSLACSTRAMHSLINASEKTHHVAAATGSVYLSDQSQFQPFQSGIVIL